MGAHKPDEYEKRFVKGEGAVYFRDKVKVPKHLLYMGVFAAASMALFLSLAGGWNPLLAAAVGIGGAAFAFFGNLALLGLRTVVSDAGVDVHLGVRKWRYALEDIVGAEMAEFRLRDYPIGRGGRRRGKAGIAYLSDMRIFAGVKLHLRSGSSVLITSTDPRGLRDAILRAIGEQAAVTGEGQQQPETTGGTIHDLLGDEPSAAAEPEPAEEEEVEVEVPADRQHRA